MSLACLVLLASECAAGDGLDEARMLLRQGLLRQAEQRLAPLLANESDSRRRAHLMLLLGNVDYERGLYVQALGSYVQAERNAEGEPSLVAAAAANRVMAEQRLGRSREVARLATRLRLALAASLILAAVAFAWLVRRARNSPLA